MIGFKKSLVNSPIRLKGNSKSTSRISGAASQTLLTGAKLRLRLRLEKESDANNGKIKEVENLNYILTCYTYSELTVTG